MWTAVKPIASFDVRRQAHRLPLRIFAFARIGVVAQELDFHPH
jgi:hypothetical protein